MSGKVTPNRIRQYRHRRKLPLRAVAQQVGQSSAAHLTHWEKKRKIPSLTNALKLSAALSCPVKVLFGPLFGEIKAQTYGRRTKYKIELAYD